MPDVWEAIRLHSRLETRRLLRDNKITERDLLPGVDIVHSMTVPSVVLDAVDRYALKLAKALHYFHSGTIVSLRAVVRVKVFTNAEAAGAAYLEEFWQAITEKPEIRRAKTSLNGQFDYNFIVVDDGAASGFIVSFGNSLVMVLMVFNDPQRYDESRANMELERRATEVIVPVPPGVP